MSIDGAMSVNTLTEPVFIRDPHFGHDPWLNDTTRPAADQDHEAALKSMVNGDAPHLVGGAVGSTIYTGADTIGADINLLPNGLNMYASYVDNYGGYPSLVNRFGSHFNGILLSITIYGHAARCADVEPYAMVPSQLPHWLDNVALKDGGQLPWVYTSASNMAACNNNIGGRKVIRWSAHYGFGPHVCGPRTCGWPQADWTQWADTGPQGQNYDRSVGVTMPTPIKPAPEPRQNPVGIANFEGSFNTHTGAWTIKGLPGNFQPGTKGRTAAARLTFDEAHGHWGVTPLPWAKSPFAKLASLFKRSA